MRNRPFIKDFRNKIDELILSTDTESVHELGQKLENELKDIRNDITFERLASTKFYYSFASITKAVLPELIKTVPFLGTGVAAYEAAATIADLWKYKPYAWVGFIADLERNKPHSRKKSGPKPDIHMQHHKIYRIKITSDIIRCCTYCLLVI